jgi:hypothetical protein
MRGSLLSAEALMCLASLLIQATRRDEMVKGSFKVELGIVREGFPAVPTRGTEGAGGIHEALKELGGGFVWGRLKREVVHGIRLRVVEALVTAHTAAETVDTFEVGLHVRAPLAGHPRCP